MQQYWKVIKLMRKKHTKQTDITISYIKRRIHHL